MRDRRDVLIAVMAAALCFSLGLWVGRGSEFLPSAAAQDGGASGEQGNPAPSTTSRNDGQPNTGATSTPDFRPGIEGRTTPVTASDSNSNNRFVAVTTPIGSGESVTFVLDSEKEQLLVYRFLRNDGLQLVAARKIDLDLELAAYRDRSEYTRDQLKERRDRDRMKGTAKESKNESPAK